MNKDKVDQIARDVNCSADGWCKFACVEKGELQKVITQGLYTYAIISKFLSWSYICLILANSWHKIINCSKLFSKQIHVPLIFQQDFSWPTLIFQVFQANQDLAEVLKFHDLPGFSWPVRITMMHDSHTHRYTVREPTQFNSNFKQKGLSWKPVFLELKHIIFAD